MLTVLMMKVRAFFSRSYRFHLSSMSEGPAYLYLPAHPRGSIPGLVSRSIRLSTIIPDYKGDEVNLDFDAEGRLVGIEVW
ncbi:MAG: hypothetical protein CMF75_10020 [Maricaulis sp.]|nr:hypothetical protein [Maricaulis sp.]